MIDIATIEAIVSPVYLVGGAVRDQLLGLESIDFDFATPLSPEEIEAAIRQAGKRPFITGKRFGTVGFKLHGQLIEITSFRQEAYRPGSRKPDVTFVHDITADLSRRDFTINAMARRDDHLIDPFDGAKDIESKLIRAVGQPTHRFKEDPLRLLRAVRLAGQLKFTIEPKTAQAIHKLSPLILGVSKERWQQELDKLLLADKPSHGLELLVQARLLNFVLPELFIQVGYDQNSPHHRWSLWEHTKKVVDAVSPDLDLRWTALLHDIGKPFTRIEKPDRSSYYHHDLVAAELVKKIGHYLRWPKARTERIATLVLNHMQPGSPIREADMQAK